MQTTQEIYIHLTADAQKQTAVKMNEISGRQRSKRSVKAELSCKQLLLWCARSDSNTIPSGS
jgi:hypothetical protein